jgi:DNA-binding transcriptional regulator GbsR (MarR family)
MPKLEEEIYATFGSVASYLGYSEVHGRIIAALVVADKPTSLTELCKRTGYSSASVSLSLDLLEIVGMLEKVKKTGDRKLYVKLKGSLVEGIRNALILKLHADIANTYAKFDALKKKGNENDRKIIAKLETELKKFENYVEKLSEVKV